MDWSLAKRFLEIVISQFYAEALVYRKSIDLNDDYYSYPPSDRFLGLVHRWPSRKNLYEFLETARPPKQNRVPGPLSPRQNARKRRDHLERYNKEVAAGSWVHKHKVEHLIL